MSPHAMVTSVPVEACIWRPSRQCAVGPFAKMQGHRNHLHLFGHCAAGLNPVTKSYLAISVILRFALRRRVPNTGGLSACRRPSFCVVHRLENFDLNMTLVPRMTAGLTSCASQNPTGLYGPTN